MCGVAGFAGSLATQPADAVTAAIRAATSTLAHRGPDGDGFWCDAAAPVALGHRRLAIIDLSEAAAQPMTSADGGRAITFNGEIYNYLALRKELEAGGCTFRSSSDTEVLLNGCREWGPVETLRRARGMFAFAYVDVSRREMWLCRDRFGEKPLYWSIWDGSLGFASELKALRALPRFPTAVDQGSVAEYLRHQAISAPRTIYQGTRQLRPGTALRVALSDAIASTDATEHVYWDAVAEADSARSRPFGGSLEDATDALEDVLARAVRGAMVSDVPLGAFLSGGIDSSTVVAMMCRESPSQVRTFTIGFEEQEMSEAAEARKVASHLGVDHTEFTVTWQQALDVIPRLADMYDEPFGDSSQIPTHLVSALAREHVTVALSGDAGDELFGGYDRYFVAPQLSSRLGKVPRPARRALRHTIHSLPPAAWDRVGTTIGRGPLAPLRIRLGDRAHKLAALLDADGDAQVYQALMSQWGAAVMVTPHDVAVEPLAAGWPFREQMMLRDTGAYLPDDILTKVDRAAMATSLETRVPMLDPEVYRLAWSLPLEYRMNGGTGKVVVRELLARSVPRHLFERPKQGFGIPLDSWLRGPLRGWAEDLLDPSTMRAQGYLDADVVQRHWREHLDGSRNWQHRLWYVLMFQAWLTRWG